jgi:hypothetical protein
LAKVFTSDPNPRYRARALWLLAAGPNAASHLGTAARDKDADIRITAFRAARQAGLDVMSLAQQLAADASPAVRREVALAMNYQPADKAVPLLVQLANQYDGEAGISRRSASAPSARRTRSSRRGSRGVRTRKASPAR